MESRKVQRQLPGKFEKADRGEARRWRGGCRRKAEETGPGRGSDGGIKAKLGPDGRKEEACGHSDGRRDSRGSGWQGATAQVIRRLPALGLPLVRHNLKSARFARPEKSLRSA